MVSAVNRRCDQASDEISVCVRSGGLARGGCDQGQQAEKQSC